MTNVQQLTSLLAALRGATVKAATVARVGRAFASAYRPHDTLSNEEAAGLAIEIMTHYIKEMVNASERRAAEQAALNALTPFDLRGDV